MPSPGEGEEGRAGIKSAAPGESGRNSAESLGMFTEPGSFEHELFNLPGELWPERRDVTLIDLQGTWRGEGSMRPE